MTFDVRLRPLVLAVASLLFVGGTKNNTQHDAAAETDDQALRAKVPSALAHQPMRFEASGSDHFVGHARGAALDLDASGATLALRGKDRSITKLSMRVAGGREVRPVASDELPTKINRLVGRDESKWQRNVATYGKVTYPSVRDGVDLVFHGEDGQLEYDFVVAPGADPSKVALNIEGSDALSLTDSGDLAIKTAAGTLLQQRPRVYQRDEQGREHDVKASFRIAGDQQIAFNVDAYDRSRPLVIDPVMSYATFLGTSGDEWASGIATSGGNAYVVGDSDSFASFSAGQFLDSGGATPNLFEIREPQQQQQGGAPYYGSDAWVAKLDNEGHVAYLTFFGGQGDDYGTALAVDGNGRVHVTGYTTSWDIKTTANAYQPELVARPNSEYSENGFLFTLNGDGSDVTYSTYVEVGTNTAEGTYCPEGFEYNCTFYYRSAPSSIALSGDQVYLGGVTRFDGTSSPMPQGIPEAMDTSADGVFVASLTAPANVATPGTLSHKFLFGGDPLESTTGLAVVGSAVYVSGQVGDPNLLAPSVTPNGVQQQFHGTYDGFVAALDTNLTSPTWFTYLGGKGEDHAPALAALPNGHVYVAGWFQRDEGSCDSDCVPAAVNGSVNGEYDAFVAHFDASHNLSWLRLLGGTDYDKAEAIAVDPLGHAFVTGSTRSTDFPTTPNFPRSYGGMDGFVSEVAADGGSLALSIYYGSAAAYSDERVTGIALSSEGVHICGISDLGAQEDKVVVPQGGQSSSSGGPSGGLAPVFFPPDHAAQSAPGGHYDALVAKIQNTPLVLNPPESTVLPETEIGFVATGGVGFGYRFEIVTKGSGSATISGGAGGNALYTAGDELGSDVVRVTDAVGNVATANVTVINAQGTELFLSPMVTSVAPKGVIQFNVSGGTPPYSFTLVANASNGSLGGTTGQYHAGARGSVQDRVRVTDATGQSKTAIVTVTQGITVTPASVTLAQNQKLTFSAMGGKGAPYTWSADQGTITSGGEFTAPLANVVVKVTATDTNGNVGTATVAVGSAIAITPVSPETFPKGTIQFQAIGGAAGYRYAVITNPAVGGSIGAETGLFTAGTNGGVTETVDVKDTAERHASTTVTVGPSLTITPSTATPAGNAQVQFSAAGGSGAGYAFSIETSQSGASIDGATGLYTAGPNGGQDVVKLVDSAGNEARATLNVSAAPNNGNGNGNGDGTGTGPGANPGASSGLTPVGVGGNGGDDDGCAVGRVGAPSPSTSALAGLGLGLMLLARRRRTRSLDA